MVWNSPELSLELSPPASSPCFLTRFPVDSDDLTKLNDYITGLESELTKIQAFKRELPLSVLLLNEAIGKLKEEARKRGDGKLDGNVGVKPGIDQHEKKTWMSSAQLWNHTRIEEDDRREEGGAFLSFREEDSGREEEEEDGTVLPGLSLLTPGFNIPFTVEPGLYSKPAFNQTARKRRRCWSPDLHRRFLDALEKLGGTQVATPKQIREFMQVDGLTNDEVKSHLQKYRLHVRKISSSISSPPSPNDASAHELGCSKALAYTSSPEGPLHLAVSKKGNSTSVEDDEDEGKSDGHSWKGADHM